ncbi:MAG TPA: aldo/keto reductase [Aestuariivirga sp.]
MIQNTPIPRIGFGTYRHLGDVAYRSVTDALEIGYRHIDTAEMYDNEREVGKAIANSKVKRNEIWLTTKVQPEHLGPGQVMPHVKASLERLGVERVDLLLIHWPSVGDKYEASDYLSQLAEIKYRKLATTIGVSNFTKKYVNTALRILGKDIVATNQVECHVFMQNRPIVDYCKAKDIPITAYCPLARGQLSESAGLVAIAKKHNATPEQVGLAFLLAEGHIVIPSSTNRGRIQSNWDARKLELSAEEISAIRKLDQNRRLVDGAWCPAWDV